MRKMWVKFCIIIVLISSLLPKYYCLYEDQTGTYDWRLQFVGRIKQVRFESGTQSTKRILVATEQNVIASLNAKTGDIGWRQIFENSEVGKIDDIVLGKNCLVTVSGWGQNLRGFSSATGSLVWEVVEETTSQHKSVLALSWLDSVAVLSSGLLKVLDIESGEVKWTKELANSEQVQYRYLYAVNRELIVVGIAPNSHISLNMITEGGVLKSQTSVPAAWTSKDTNCILVSGQSLVCLDSSTLQSVSLNDPKVFKTTLLQDLSLTPQKVSLIDIQLNSLVEDAVPVFGLRLSPTHVALLSVEKSNIKVLKDLPGTSAVQVFQSGDKQAFVSFTQSPAGTEVKFYDVATAAEMDVPVVLDFPQHHGLAEQLYVITFRKKDGNPGYRTLVLSEDHSLALVQQSGRVSWTREESLSSVLSVELVDLPVSPLLAKMEDEFGHTANDDILALFVKRFSTQFSQLQEFLLSLKNKLRTPRHTHQRHLEDMEDEDEEDELDDEEYLTRDEFNLHKLIVVGTSAGKLFGIDNLTGRLLWRIYLPDMKPFTKYGQMTLPLLVQRTTAHFPNRPICTVVGKNKVTGQGMIFSFDPITGEPVRDMPPVGQTLNYNILQLFMTTQLDEHFEHPLVILDTNLEFHVHPESAEKVIHEIASSLYVFTADINNGILQGYGMINNNNKLVADKLWSVNLIKEVQTITNVVPKRLTEHVHSQGIVLGDRSVMYKYLNPNLAVVTTEGVDNTQKPFLNVFLIDVVSGLIVFQCNHKRAKGPVRVVHSENWVLYNYWNQKHRRNEISVLEMYEGKKQSNATAFSSLSPPPAPIVMRQAYIFPGHISAMAATITEKGITSKHVLMALETGGILEMAKVWLDPRRPEIPTQEHKEEGIVPYIPELPRPYEAMVNYNQSVFNIRGIHTSPAGLESTSLVLCYGLDLFYTRVMPSKMFDVLKEDFDYFFISSVLIGMILVSIITQKLAVRKALNRAWK